MHGRGPLKDGIDCGGVSLRMPDEFLPLFPDTTVLTYTGHGLFRQVCALLTWFGFCDGSCFWGNSLGIIAFFDTSSVFVSLYVWCIPNKRPVADTLYTVEIFDGGHCTKQ